ncbi:hypothetical protein B296_00041463 [Ensete ventricosum]|uniref:Uncharacterized protein n=1 Tax=Ensete ventricosum TaxID=4639 RepID=A0A426YHZ0_ENSVE|nr:hypothetical protein B296_00041463 [Ensete ventricosum]
MFVSVDEKDGGWHRADVAIVAKVEEGEVDEWEHSSREATEEAIIAKVEFVEEGKVGEGGNDVIEAVGVGVEEHKVRKLVNKVVDDRGREDESIEVDGGIGALVIKPWGVSQ